MFAWLKSLLPGPRSGVTGTKVVRLEDLFGGSFTEANLADLRNYESYLKAGSRRIWATWKACHVCANSVAEVQTKLVRSRPDGNKVPASVPELDRLLRMPNPTWSWWEMVYLWVFHMKLTGNAYWFKNEQSVVGGRPGSLYPMNPRKVKISIDPHRGVMGYLYHVNGLVIPMDVEEVIHWKNPHPDDDYHGLGDVEAGEDLFQEFLNRNNYSRKFWKNGAAPSGVLICEERIADAQEFEKAKAKWQAQYGGTENAGKTAWLTGKWTYQKLGLTAVEMQSIEDRRLSVENIMAMHGVPLSTAGVKDAANYATARVDDLIFRRNTVKPLVGNFYGTLNTDLVADWGADLELVPEISGLVDLDAVVTHYVPLFDRGALSLNELREKAGLPRVEDDPAFDEHYINAGLVPLHLSDVPPVDGSTDRSARAVVDRFVANTLASRSGGAGGNGAHG